MNSANDAGAVAAPEELLAFWQAAGKDKWFEKDDAFDAEVRARFLATHEAGASGKLSAWEETPRAALALVIVLDQFPRNMFRGDARTYATDAQALAVAQRALDRGFDQQVPEDLRSFFYLPFMHSEQLADQERCVELYRAIGDDYSLEYAEDHAAIIRRFGRFPHRNKTLGRATTPEEQAFLDGGGFAG
jgi:uncharacterized protein (DUF924 family)